MSPFEDFNGMKCNTPISWNDPVKRVHIKLDMLNELEQEVVSIKQKMNIAQDRQQSYADQ